MVHIGGFFMGLKKNHRISNFLLHQIAYFCGEYIKKKEAVSKLEMASVVSFQIEVIWISLKR